MASASFNTIFAGFSMVVTIQIPFNGVGLGYKIYMNEVGVIHNLNNYLIRNYRLLSNT
jgi:hypothetical protein